MSKPELECILQHYSRFGVSSQGIWKEISLWKSEWGGREWAPECDFESLIPRAKSVVSAQCENACFRIEPGGLKSKMKSSE